MSNFILLEGEPQGSLKVLQYCQDIEKFLNVSKVAKIPKITLKTEICPKVAKQLLDWATPPGIVIVVWHSNF